MNLFNIQISEKILTLIILIIVGIVIYAIINSILTNKININKKLSKHEKRSRQTVLMLFKNTLRIVIIAIVILAILQDLGVNTSALVAGVGAATVVIGLAFQDVLKDLLVGAAIILESQFAIGEIVQINGFKGEVIALNLRSTRIKSLTGEVKIIANRNISEVINYSLDSILYKVLVSVSYESDNTKVEKVLNKTIERLNKEIDDLIEPISIEGIDALASSSVDYLLTFKSTVKNQLIIKRKILKEVKLDFDKNNIKIPYPQIEVHNEQ